MDKVDWMEILRGVIEIVRNTISVADETFKQFDVSEIDADSVRASLTEKGFLVEFCLKTNEAANRPELLGCRGHKWIGSYFSVGLYEFQGALFSCFHGCGWAASSGVFFRKHKEVARAIYDKAVDALLAA